MFCNISGQILWKWQHNAVNEYKTPTLCLVRGILFSWVTQTWFIFRLISCNSTNRIMMLVPLWVPSLMITTSFHLVEILMLLEKTAWIRFIFSFSVCSFFSCFAERSRNVLSSTKHPPTSHQHGGWVDTDLYSYFLGELLLDHKYSDHVNLRTFSLSEERTCWRVFKELPERIIVRANSGNRKADPDAFSCSRLEYLSVLMSETCLKKYS